MELYQLSKWDGIAIQSVILEQVHTFPQLSSWSQFERFSQLSYFWRIELSINNYFPITRLSIMLTPSE